MNTITATDTWRTLAPMKSPRGSVGVTVLDGKVHAVGGRGVDNTFTVGTHEVFDPATGQWSRARAVAAAARPHGAGRARRQAARHRRARHQSGEPRRHP